MFVYVASPYSSDNPFVMNDRFLAVEQFTANLIKDGIHALSPIAMFHRMAERHSLPKDAEYWSDLNYGILKNCDKVYVLKLDGWKTSKGVVKELQWAKELNIPVLFFESEFMKEYTPNGNMDIHQDQRLA